MRHLEIPITTHNTVRIIRRRESCERTRYVVARQSVSSLEIPEMMLSVTLDTRPACPRKCTDNIDERSAVTQTTPKVSGCPKQMSVSCTLSVHIPPPSPNATSGLATELRGHGVLSFLLLAE